MNPTTLFNKAVRTAARALLAPATLLAASCSAPGIVDEPDAPANEGEVYLSMTLDVPSGNPDSRAVIWDDDYDNDQGTASENAIDTERLTVVVRQGDSAAALGRDALTFYSFRGSILLYCSLQRIIDNGTFDPSAQFDVEIYANCRQDINPANPDALSFRRDDITAPGSLLPMFGFRRGIPSIKTGSVTDIGSIGLLRAVAKVDVRLSPAAARTYEFDTANPPRLVNGMALVPATGFQTPLREKWSKVLHTGALPFADSRNAAMPASPAAAGHIALNRIDNGYEIYIPETVSAPDNETHFGIDVNLRRTDGSGRTCSGRLFFADYDPATNLPAADSDPRVFALTRNHIYSFAILNADDDITLTYEVIAANEVTITVPDYD